VAASTRAASASTLAVIPMVGRAELALSPSSPDESRSTPDYRRPLSGGLIGEAIQTVSAAFRRVLVVSPTAHGWFAPHPIDWLIPHGDEEFLDRIAPFDRVIVHDLLCPLTPGQFLREMAAAEGPATVAVSPLVDTVKSMDGDRVVHTLDRDRMRVVASPVVVDREIIAQVPDVVAALSDLAVLVTRLRAMTEVTLAPAPFGARRVSDAADLRVLSLRRLA
jgi:hypothetical protein